VILALPCSQKLPSYVGQLVVESDQLSRPATRRVQADADYA
jgi:hypothetical protein